MTTTTQQFIARPDLFLEDDSAMGEYIGRGRKARRCYGFDEIALVPGAVTINPNEVDPSWTLGDRSYRVPILASAMDGVVDVRFAVAFGKLGGLAVLNLEGVQTRYHDPDEVIAKIVKAAPEQATGLLQQAYREPVKPKLVAKRVQEIKKHKVPAVVSAIPQRAAEFGPIAQEAGADIFVVQSTVSTVRHVSREYKVLDLAAFCGQMDIPIIVGNCVTHQVCLELMEAGADGVLVGLGPGAACTTRGVIGVGVPQVTATVDCAAARDDYFKDSGRYVPIITDGGMRTGGDVCKAFAAGSDAVMIGSPFARAKEAPGKGFHWGMATPHANLPRGTRIRVGVTGTVEEILFGPAHLDDGSQNLMGALVTCMGSVGAKDIKELQRTEIIIAPSIQTEGKLFQRAQGIGMGK